MMTFLARLRERFRPAPSATAPADSVVASPAPSLPPPLTLWETAGERDVWAVYYQRSVAEERGYLAAHEAAFVARSDHGVLPLAEDDLTRYAALYGGHHIAKLTAAFSAADLGKLSGATIEIYDWGCGQALASCLMIDFLRELCVRASVRRVTLIEPGRFALERGTQLLTRTLGGEGYIRAVCAPFGDLTAQSVRAASDEDVKIHLFSNILDVDGVDSWKLVKLIAAACPGRNAFICVSPRYKFSRLEKFAGYFQSAVGSASGVASVTGFCRNLEPLTARIFDPRRGDFKEHVITRDEVRFAVQIEPINAGTLHEIPEPFGTERFGTRTRRALRKFFRPG